MAEELHGQLADLPEGRSPDFCLVSLSTSNWFSYSNYLPTPNDFNYFKNYLRNPHGTLYLNNPAKATLRSSLKPTLLLYGSGSWLETLKGVAKGSLIKALLMKKKKTGFNGPIQGEAAP